MKTKLFDGTMTLPQALIAGFWILNLLTILVLWQQTSFDLIISGTSGAFTAIGRLLGLLAAYFALTQFMLMGRLAWLEHAFGLDHLASYHRKNGNYAYVLIILHPLFIAAGYALATQNNVIKQYIDLVVNYPHVWLAFIAEILFTIVVGTSIYIVRRKLKFESWYYVHLLVYIAITVAFFHQVTIGGSFLGHPLAVSYWYGLYGFVVVNLLIWRFGLPVISMYRFDLRIERVVRETPTAVSVYIKGRNLRRWHTLAGQFIFIRIFDKHHWLQEHPFSLSALAKDNQLRITVREVGDYTQTLKNLKPNSRVLISGPFGRFTKVVSRSNKKLFIAGGVGITPILPMIKESLTEEIDTVLIYANRSPEDVIFGRELDDLRSKGLTLHSTYSHRPPGLKEKGITGHVNATIIQKLIPDLGQYDIYLCGPPSMMASLIEGFSVMKLSEPRLHYETFNLHR